MLLECVETYDLAHDFWTSVSMQTILVGSYSARVEALIGEGGLAR